MGRKTRRPELCIHRMYMNECEKLDALASAYRAYFDEAEASNLSKRTFDSNEDVDYNSTINESGEEDHDGPAA